MTVRMCAMLFVSVVLPVSAALLLAVGAVAQEPTLSDIATCNEQATAQTRGAVLALPRPRPSTPPTPPAASDGTREKTDPSGSVITESPDPLVKGMDAERASDPDYRLAYRRCMERQKGRR